MKILDLKS